MRLRAAFAVIGISLAVAGCGRPVERQRGTATGATDGPAPPKTLESTKVNKPRVPPVGRDLPQIAGEKVLRVLFTSNATGYFIYRGETLGYEYELASRFAGENGLRLLPVVVRDSSTLLDRLNAGDGDIVAAQLVKPERAAGLALTASLYETAPVVVQRTAERPGAVTPAVSTALERERKEEDAGIKIRARVVSTPAELAGRKVHLSRSSPYKQRLIELENEVDGDIDVLELDETTDKLIQRLSEGEIGYTIAAENVALLRTAEYTNLMIRPAIGPPQQVVWGVRQNAPQLLTSLNSWLEKQRKSGLLRMLYRKYFMDRRGYARRAGSDYLTSETGRLSQYDQLFRQFAAIPGWDWRLVASQCYQESRFDERARSWAGAIGVMQIMPRTARELKVNASIPAQAIEGASRYLWKLDQEWRAEITDEKERRKFILASYNIGRGHVEDARRLANKHGENGNDWDNVAYWLLRKSKKSVYNDPVVKYGFARGIEAVNYVGQILDRYENYKDFVKADHDSGE